MAPTKVGLRKIKLLYEKIKNKSVRQALEEFPESIMIFRFGLGMTLVKFGESFGFSYALFSQIERGKIKKINNSLLSKIVSEISNIPSLEDVIKNYKNFSEISKGGQRQAMLRAEKAEFTEEEKQIFLTMKKHGLFPEFHKTLGTSAGPVNVDFLLRTAKGMVVFETTSSRKRQKMESLDFRAIKIKRAFSGSRLVAIIPNGISIAIRKRLEDFDDIIELKDFESSLHRF